MYTNNTNFNWTAGSPIVINDPGDQTNTVGDTVSLPVVATDSASGTLTYSISGLPSGLSISSSTGAITGTLTGSVASSPYTTTITVTDGTRTDTDTFSWYVNSAGPVIAEKLVSVHFSLDVLGEDKAGAAHFSVRNRRGQWRLPEK